MPVLSSLFLAASFVVLPANAEPVAVPDPAPVTLSPNNCGTPDTPKPCHTAKTIKSQSTRTHK